MEVSVPKSVPAGSACGIVEELLVLLDYSDNQHIIGVEISAFLAESHPFRHDLNAKRKIGNILIVNVLEFSDVTQNCHT